ALIIDLDSYARDAPPSSRLIPVCRCGFDVTLRVLPKALLLFRSHRPLHLRRHTHHETLRGHLHTLRDHRTGGNDGATSYFRAIQDDGANSNQALVFDCASMKHCEMAHRHATANLEREQA